MKFSKPVLAITAALLLPAFANAGDDTDAIRASFVRDLDRGGSNRALDLPAVGAQPRAAINKGADPDPILVSFARILPVDLAPLQGGARSEAQALAAPLRLSRPASSPRRADGPCTRSS